MIRSTGGEIKVTMDVPDMLNAASVPLSSTITQTQTTGDLTLFPKNTTLVVGPGFKTNPVTYPGQPVGLNAETFHEAFEGRELIELVFGARFAP